MKMGTCEDLAAVLR